MYYLLRAVPNTNACGVLTDTIPEGGEVGLFSLQGLSPKPAIKLPEGALGFESAEDLGVAIAKFFRETKKSIDSIDATEQIELVNIPLFAFIPYVVNWDTEPPIIYTRLSIEQYVAVVNSITKELGE